MAAPEQDPGSKPIKPEVDAVADLAQAYRDLTRGEQAASSLERNLSNLESKLDSILAAFETDEGGPAGAEKQSDGSNKTDKTEKS